MIKNYSVRTYYNDKYEILIIDDEFSEIIFLDGDGYTDVIFTAIEICYSKRNLPVAENMAILLRNNWGDFGLSLDNALDYISKFSYTFKKYKDQVEKILLFN